MDFKHLNMLVKIYREYNEYDWKELSYMSDYNVKDIYPANIDKNISTYYVEIGENLMIVVGSFYYRFYYEEDSYREEKQEFVSINTINKGKKVKNIEVITSSDLQRFMRQNYMEISMENIPNENYIELLFSKVNEKVNNFDDIYNSFMND